MRKSILLLGLALCLSTAGFSQVSLGVKGGLNFANLDVTSASATYDQKTGYHVGAFLRIKVPILTIQPEVIYSRQGATVKDVTSSSDAHLDYFNIPIILKLNLPLGLNIQAGPQFGFLASAKIGDQNIKDELKGSDTSIAMGLGWDLPFGLCVDARYNLGISEINDAAASNATKNQVFQLSAGFKFGGNSK